MRTPFPHTDPKIEKIEQPCRVKRFLRHPVMYDVLPLRLIINTLTLRERCHRHRTYTHTY